MKRILVLLVLLFVSLREAAAAEKPLREISWVALRDQGALAEGSQVQADGSLSLASKPGQGLSVTLAEIANPGITRDRYVVRGRVRYHGVIGEGYLEMWSLFGDGGRYFTRTLGDAGPLQKIAGTSDWRDFGLYFDATGAAAPPEKLILGLVLPGAGVVSISELTLVELDPAMRLENVGRWGGIAGGILGVFGAIVGSLAGAGRARTFVLASLKVLMAAGLAGLAVGILALFRNDPRETYYRYCPIHHRARGSALCLPACANAMRSWSSAGCAHWMHEEAPQTLARSFHQRLPKQLLQPPQLPRYGG
jgi:hypothetical protein